MSSRVIVEFEGVSFRYGRAERWAARDLSFRVYRGEVLGLVGPNGSGKTTIFRLLMGFLKAEDGCLSIGGDEPAEHRVKNGIGYLPEQVRLPADVRVYEFAMLMARLAGLAAEKARSAVAELMNTLSLADRSTSPIGWLSHGYRQRVGLLAALLGDPQLILMDEPANGLDPSSVGVLRYVIRTLKRQGRTVIVSSHNLAELERVCDELLILREGTSIGRFKREAFTGRPDVWIVRLGDNGRLRLTQLGRLRARFGGVQLATDETGFKEGRCAREFARRLTVAGAVVETIERRHFDLEFLFHSMVQEHSPEIGSTHARDS